MADIVEQKQLSIEIVAKDKNGVLRCYGFGATGLEALNECKRACLKYLQGHPDIKTLYLYHGDSMKPMLYAHQATVSCSHSRSKT